VGADGWPIRQIEVYDSGPTLRYGPDHQEGQYGGLSQVRLYELEDWSPWAISSEDFEAAWDEER
jgi:hypothetical protein